MLAGRSRFSHFLFFFFVVAFAVVCLPVRAQVYGGATPFGAGFGASVGSGSRASVTALGPNGWGGVAASVTSLNFGNRRNTPLGIQASVTALGQNAYGDGHSMFERCCTNAFSPVRRKHPLSSDGRHHRGDKDRGYFPVGIMEPAYIPYAVPYVVGSGDDAADEDAADDEVADAPPVARPRKATVVAQRVENSKPDSEVAEPVTAQPSTLLVFKDGHQSDVLNYAIVGDTLFDFGDGRTRKILLADLDLGATRKANDDRGVDFQVPASAAR